MPKIRIAVKMSSTRLTEFSTQDSWTCSYIDEGISQNRHLHHNFELMADRRDYNRNWLSVDNFKNLYSSKAALIKRMPIDSNFCIWLLLVSLVAILYKNMKYKK